MPGASSQSRRFVARPGTSGSALAAALVFTMLGSTDGPAAAGADPPRAIVMEDIRRRPERQAQFVDDYEEAVVSIGRVATRELGLPPLRGVLHLVPDREALHAVLQANGADPATARDAATRMLAIGTKGAVYVNQAAFSRFNWNARLAILSHELTHVAEYEWSGGERGSSDQWLREGFADWVQAHVLDSLGVMARDGIVRRNSRFISRPGKRDLLPALGGLVTFPEWVQISTGPAGELLYPYAFIATDFLIERHSLKQTIDYFRRSGASDDRLGNFRTAFGEDFATFDPALRAHVGRLRPD